MPTDYILLGLVGAYIAWRAYSSFSARRRIPSLLAQGAQVVDVRGPAEFAGGHAPGSLNIPLPELDQRAGELDPKRYGVIVQAGGRRGLLLPDLDGVDTVEQQIGIATMKAGIPAGAQVAIFKFEVRRYK